MIDELTCFVPLPRRHRARQKSFPDDASVFDITFLNALARAYYWQHLLDTGIKTSGSEIASEEGLHHSVVNELLRLTLLAPDIIEQLIAGRQPSRLNLMWFQRHPLPVDWNSQRDIVASFE